MLRGFGTYTRTGLGVYRLTGLILFLIVSGFPFSQGLVRAVERDFRKAFALFHELGYPDVKGGRLVHLELTDNAYWRFSRETVDVFPAANAWLMAAPSNAPASFVTLFGQPLLVMAAEPDSKDGAESAGDESETAQAARIKRGTWTLLSFPEYLAALTNSLGEIEANDLSEEKRYLLGSAFFMAAGLHQNGLESEAVALIDLVLSRHPDSETFLSACIGALAAPAYQKALSEWRAGGGSVELAERLRALRIRFGPRWADYAVAGRLENALRAPTGSVMAAFTDASFPAWSAGCVRDLLSGNESVGKALDEIQQYPWILAPKIPAAEAALASNPVVRLLDGGMDSIPLLLAMSTNPAPVRLSSGDYREERNGVEPAAAAFLGSMERRGSDPFARSGGSGDDKAGIGVMTLADVAWSLLTALPLKGEEEVDRLTGAYRDWYDAHRNDSRIELAMAYIREGGHTYHASTALGILMKEGGDRERKDVEPLIISMAEKPLGGLSMAESYVRHLPPREGEAFRAKFSALVRDSLAAPETNAADPDLFVGEGMRGDDWETREIKEQLERFSKGEAGRSFTAPSFETMVSAIVSSNAIPSSHVLQAATLMAGPGPAVDVITNTVMQTTNLQAKVTLTGLLAMLRYGQVYGAEANGEEKQAEPAAIPVPWRPAAAALPKPRDPRLEERKCPPPELAIEKLAPFWRAMLADERLVEDQGSAARAAAQTMEILYNEGLGYDYPVRSLFGEEWDRMQLRRARARLEGKPLPEWPSLKAAAKVDRAAVEAALAAVSAAELPSVTAQLDSLSALAFSLKDTTNAILAERLSAAACRVVSAPAGFPVKAGDRLTTNAVRRIVESLTATNAGGRVGITIRRQSLLNGVTIERHDRMPGKSDYSFRMLVQYELDGREALPPGTALIYGQAQGPGAKGLLRQGNDTKTFWTTAEPAPVAAEAAASENLDAKLVSRQSGRRGDRSEQEFQELVGRVCAGAPAPLAEASIRLYRIPDEIWRTNVTESAGGDYPFWGDIIE